MAFLAGAVSDPYVTEALDQGLVSGWRMLVKKHEDLRPLLLPVPEDQPDLPPLTDAATAEAGLQLTDDVAKALDAADPGVVGQDVVTAVSAIRRYFDYARDGGAMAGRALRAGFRALGGLAGQIVMVGGSAVTIATWAATPQGQALIAKLQPLFEAIVKLFGG